MQESMIMVGPYGDWVRYDMEEPCVLTPEVDGVRILTSQRHELLRRVPDALVDIFRIGSTSPGCTPAPACLSMTPRLTCSGSRLL